MIDQLAGFATLLQKWNRRVNLISRQDMNRLVSRRLMDSLSAYPWVHGPSVLDIGTGAGLPGIPLAIALPKKRFYLCDRMSRRIRFLHAVCQELKLANVTLVEKNLVAAADGLPHFDTILARGVATAGALWPTASVHLSKQGRVIVYGHALAEEQDQTGGEEYRLQEMRCDIPGIAHPHYLQLMTWADDARQPGNDGSVEHCNE